MNSSHPIPFENLVAYWAGDLSPAETEQIDEHLMGCAACSSASARVAAVTEAIRNMLPPVISEAYLGQLRERGLAIEENAMRPGERRAVVFGPHLDLLVHRLGGMELAGAEEVRITIRVEETGETIMEHADVPFERDTGEVLLACQRHFAVFPPNIVAEVRAREPSGLERVAIYTIPHVYVERAGA
jgi:hypothetical protein